MKSKIFLASLLSAMLLLISNSCGDEYFFASEADCEDCIYPKPDLGSLKIEFSDTKSSGYIILKVFKGKYNESPLETNLYYQDTLETSPAYIDNVPVNEFYSAEVTYAVSGRKVKVVDGSELKVNSIKSTCEKDCYIYRGGEMDCRLKF